MHEKAQCALKLAAEQHGVVSSTQLRRAGFDRPDRQVVRTSGAFTPTGPRVLVAVGSADTPERRAMVSVLDTHDLAMLSHTSAAARWELPGYELEPLHVIGDRGNQHRTAPYQATVHEPRLLSRDHRTVLDGLPLTTPARTLFDLANLGLHPKRIERAVDAAWSRNLVNRARLEAVLRQLAKRGRRGIRLMRELIEDRAENYRPPESGLEKRFEEIVDLHGGPRLRRQVDVGDGDQWIGRIDYVAEDGVPFLVRVQSARYHSALIDQRDDERKNRLLRAAGWVVMEITDVDVWQRPKETVAQVTKQWLPVQVAHRRRNPRPGYHQR
ncbi:MAG: hypothetical protein ACR2QE_12505 [Acidimicrobiales bacterium]